MVILEEKLNFLLIFAATALGSLILIKLAIRYMQEQQEYALDPRFIEMKRFIEPRAFLSLRTLIALSSFATLFILQLLFGVEKMYIAIPVGIAAGVLGWKLTLWWYLRLVAKRKEAFQSKILELTMGLASGMKSGLALGQALDAVSRRIGDPMREEIVQVLRENRYGVDFPTAFENLSKRMPCEDMHLLTTSISLTTRSGGSLAEVLDEMTDTIRKRTEFQERLKSMTAQGRYEALVISLAPVAAFVMFYFIDPELMRPLVQTWIGWCAIGAAGILIYIGYKILLKITNVEV